MAARDRDRQRAQHATAPPWALQELFGDQPDPYRLLVFMAGLGFMIAVVSHGVRVINDYVNAKVEQNMVMDLRSDMFDHVSKLSLTFHDEKHTGMLMSLINMQAAAIGSIVMAFPPMFESLLMLIGMLTIALLIDWQVTLVSLVCVPFIYWALGMYGTRIVPRIRQVQSLEFRSLSIVFEAMSMLRVIVGFGRERLEHYRFTTQGRTAVEARVRLTVWQTLFSLGVTTAIALGTALVLGFGAWHVLRGDITLGQLTVLIAYIAAIYQPLESISQHDRPAAPAVRVPQRRPCDDGREAGGDREGGRDRHRPVPGRARVQGRLLRVQGPRRHAEEHLLQGAGPARGWRSWGRRAPARRRWSACSCATTTPHRG